MSVRAGAGLLINTHVVKICVTVVGLNALGLCGGCSSGLMEKTAIQSAQVAYDQAVAFEAEGNMPGANEQIELALTAGGLNPDLLAEAYLLRARCRCALGEVDAAAEDVALADRGSPNPSQWHFTRGILFKSQGEAAQSKSEFAKARRLDPSLKIP
jgi:tetratricopeptide (TPR) repeat protein